MLAYGSLFSIAVYKALYKSFGGFAADVVAAVDQVCMICLIVFHYKSCLVCFWLCNGSWS